jgi:hypothetical protein
MPSASEIWDEHRIARMKRDNGWMGVTDDEIQKPRTSTSGSTGMVIGGPAERAKVPVSPVVPGWNKRKCLMMFLIQFLGRVEAIVRIPEDEKGRDLEGWRHRARVKRSKFVADRIPWKGSAEDGGDRAPHRPWPLPFLPRQWVSLVSDDQ